MDDSNVDSCMDDTNEDTEAVDDTETTVDDETTTVIVVLGATEQHGPHLPLGTDTLVGEELATRIARRLGDTVVGPILSVGYSPSHREFPGTLSLSLETFLDVVRDTVNSLDQQGFDYVVLLPSHGGNVSPVRALAPELAADLDSASVIPLADLDQFVALCNEGLASAGIEYEVQTPHAGAIETAIMKAIQPTLVDDSAFVTGPDSFDSYAQFLEEGFTATPDGVLGDPSIATPEIGETILETIVKGYTKQIEYERQTLESKYT